MEKIKLNGASGIIIIVITLILAGGTILLAVGGKKFQINNNTREIANNKQEIANNKKVRKDFRDKVNNKLETILGDVKVIKYALGIKKKEVE